MSFLIIFSSSLHTTTWDWHLSFTLHFGFSTLILGFHSKASAFPMRNHQSNFKESKTQVNVEIEMAVLGFHTTDVHGVRPKQCFSDIA